MSYYNARFANGTSGDPLDGLSEEEIHDLARKWLIRQAEVADGNNRGSGFKLNVARLSTNGKQNMSANIMKFSDAEEMDVTEWLEQYEMLTKAGGWSHEKMVRLIPFYLDGTAMLWYKEFMKRVELNKSDMKRQSGNEEVVVTPTSEETEKQNYELWEEMKKEMIEHFGSKMKNIRLRQILNNFRQQPNENVSTYYLNLTNLYRKFNRETLSDEQVKSSFIDGLHPLIQQKVLMVINDKSTLMEVLEKAKLAEFALQSTYEQPYYNNNYHGDGLRHWRSGQEGMVLNEKEFN